jgi:hypothetical protein
MWRSALLVYEGMGSLMTALKGREIHPASSMSPGVIGKPHR